MISPIVASNNRHTAVSIPKKNIVFVARGNQIDVSTVTHSEMKKIHSFVAIEGARVNIALAILLKTNLLYCSTNDTTVIWDVTDPTNPKNHPAACPQGGIWVCTANEAIHMSDSSHQITIMNSTGKMHTIDHGSVAAPYTNSTTLFCLNNKAITIYTDLSNKAFNKREILFQQQAEKKIMEGVAATSTFFALRFADEVRVTPLDGKKKETCFDIESNNMIFVVENYFALVGEGSIEFYNQSFKEFECSAKPNVGKILDLAQLQGTQTASKIFVLGDKGCTVVSIPKD